MITPAGYIPFRDDEEYRQKCVAWGLIPEKTKILKKEFIYKGTKDAEPANLVGYLESVFVVVQFSSGGFHSIHPAFLKEMQSAKFIYPNYVSGVDTGDAQRAEESADAEMTLRTPVKRPPAKKPAQKRVVLPEGKVAMQATVDRFDTKYAPFTEGDQEVIIFRDVSLAEEEAVQITAWSNYSATLQKANLTEGDRITLEGRLAEKKIQQ